MNKFWTNYLENFEPPLPPFQPSPAPYLKKLKDEKIATGMASSLSLGEGWVSGLRLYYILSKILGVYPRARHRACSQAALSLVAPCSLVFAP